MRKILAFLALLSLSAQAANPVAELNDVIPIDISDYTCDATVTTGDGDWTTKVNDSGNAVVCIAKGDHSAKGEMIIEDNGSAGTNRSISAITLNNPVRVDFSAAHGWTTNDIIHCDAGAGGTWQARWRYFRVTVIDTDTVDLQNQDGTGAGNRPAWTTYTSGGICQRPNFKIIRHADDIASHPSLLADGDRAKIRNIQCGTGSTPTNYLMLIGLTTDHKGLASSITNDGNDMWGCDYVIVDQQHDYNLEALSDIEADFQKDGWQLGDGGDSESNFIQIQRSVFGERGSDGGTDSFYLMIGVDDANGVHFIQNETASSMSGWQKQQQAGLYGFLYAENTDYLTTLVYTDCSGNLVGGTTFGASDSSPCAVAESAGAFKGSSDPGDGRIIATAANRHLLNVVDANVQCCRREEDGVISDGGSGGQSYGFSSPGGANTIRNVLFRNNAVFANNHGIPEGVTTGGATVLTTEYTSTVGNINYDINYGDTPHGIAWFSHTQVVTRYHEFIFNSFVDMPNWAGFTRMQTSTFECSLLIDAGGRFGDAITQKNNYGYGNTVDMDGTGDNDGGSVANANMTDLVVNPTLWTDSAFTFTLSGVLSTATSPHLGDCPSIGTSGRGVVDDTVTF